MRGVRDLILQVFIHGAENSIHSELPLVPAVMAREVRAHISFAIAAILKDDDRRGLRVGIQERVRITDASRDAQENVRRKCVRVVNLAGCFLLLGILALARLLLDEFVRHLVANRVLPECQEKTVAV